MKKRNNKLAMVGMMAAAAAFAPSLERVQTHEPTAIIKSARKRLSGREQRRRDNRKANRAGQRENFVDWAKRLLNRGDNMKAYKLIKSMTNWQNHQWQKSFKGDPNKRNDLENVEKFAVMVKS